MTQFFILLVFAILVEAIINMTIGDIPTPKWVKRFSAIALGVAVCIVWKVGIIGLLGIEGGMPTFDYVITGIVISRGSNIVNDIITRIKGGNATVTTTVSPSPTVTVTEGDSTTTATTPTL
jgi:hypothetical protein